MSLDGTAASPLEITYSRHSEFDLADAIRWLLQTFGEETATHFGVRLEEELTSLAQSIATEIAESGRYRAPVHEPASAYFARPVYRHSVSTTKKRARRSSAGLWHVYFELQDRNRRGLPDTLIVHSIQHSASRPYAVQTD